MADHPEALLLIIPEEIVSYRLPVPPSAERVSRELVEQVTKIVTMPVVLTVRKRG